MEFKKYISIKDNLIKNNLLLKFTIVVQTILIIYLIETVLYRTDNQKTVFLPPQVTYKEFWVTNNEVSRSYLDNIGAFIAYNILNVDKYNLKDVAMNIMPLVDTHSLKEVAKELRKMAKYIKDNELSRIFYLKNTSTKFDKEKKQKYIIVSGLLKESVDNSIVSAKKVDLIIGYKIKFGKFYITNLELKDK